jgi:hypothetical protein
MKISERERERKKRSITENATEYITRECFRKQNKMCLGKTKKLDKHTEKARKLILFRLKMMHTDDRNMSIKLLHTNTEEKDTEQMNIIKEEE